MKSFKNILIVTLPTLIVLIILLEIFFRLIIPASNPPLSLYDFNEGIPHYSQKVKSGTYTIGKFAEIKSKWTINNFGFNFFKDFQLHDERGEKPLIAVIGDSYIEAIQVDSDKNYPAILNKKLKGKFEVYGIGMSGSPLSQYYHFNKYVNNKFDPDILIFQLIHNDFDESLYKYNPNSIFWTVDYDSVDGYFLRPPDKKNIAPTSSTPWKKLLYKSALFRYLHRNLLVSQIFKSRETNKEAFESNTIVISDKDKRNEIIKGVTYLFQLIKAENSGKRVIFVFDAPRGAIYENRLKDSDVLWMHDFIENLTRQFNFEYIDLTEPMKNDFINNSLKFNSELDVHWDEYGHEFVANILIDYLLKLKQKE